ncbi:hypothetical protein BN946_scf184884.g5 [Trametes cinnabarina]|uniref:F-box domain-containing protein n=1 Tax=Pycnoporus cinnabarinus TaxID=5643 RepID=A0A060S6N5_PYCCI|nr:hypothetical protein BN946_scf184884.g5 [Trametes cinnabarina]
MPGTVLLPNLTALHIIDRTETVREKSVLFLSLYVLFGPKLRIFRGHCAAGTRTPGDALGYAIQKLAEISPGLVYLNLFPTGRSSHACPLISNALCSLLHLSDVAIASTPISLKAFLHLARLPSLRTLGVLLENGIEEQVLAALAESDDANYLPQLTGLSLIYDGGMRVASTIIRKVRSPHLRNVRIINESESVHSLDMHELFLSIAICNGCASIRSVYVTVSEIPEDDAITEYTIAPLLILQKLTELRIRASGRFSINDLACLVIAKTWPDLRTLNLGPQRLDETPPATLTGLVYLAQGCRHLHSLGLAINPDVTRLPRICKLARPGLGFVQKKLVTMDVGRSKIRDPMAVAAFLSDLFPKLDNIDDGFPCEEDAYDEYVETEEEREKILADAVHHTRWSEVMFDFLPEFVQIRKQERRWGLRHGEQPIPRVKII